MPLCGYMLLSDAVYIIYITPREAAESDIPFQRFVDCVNTNATVYNPAHERPAACLYEIFASAYTGREQSV